MRSISLCTSLVVALASQEGDEAAYLLQTRAQQQKSGEVEDCYVTGGCKTTTTTTPPLTCGTFECKDGFVTRPIFQGKPGNVPCGKLCSNFKCCKKEIVTCQDWQDDDEGSGCGDGMLFNRFKAKLLCGLKGCDSYKCCKAKPTTTESTTTTTVATTTTVPTVGERKEKPPPPRPGKKKTGDPKEDPEDYCVDKNYLDVSNCTVNNLGGMGPETWKAQELRYSGVTTVKGEAVDLVITVLGQNKYKSENMKYHRRNKLFGHTGGTFIGKYNGNKYRQDVMAIGSLAKGSFNFKFSFVKQSDGSPVVVPRVVFTLYDLDGQSVRVGRQVKSYEEMSTYDACMMEADDHSDVTYECEMKKRMGKEVQYCHAESARVEIPIPANFDNPDQKAKQASLTLMYSKKSSFVMTYTLNYPHRVFLFKGQCVD